jgi:DNA mismatch repair protein MutL
VRFQQPRLVHDFFTSQLTKVLAASNAKTFEKTYEPVAYSAEEDSETYIAQSNEQFKTVPSVAIQLQRPVMRQQVSREAIDSWSPRHEITAANKSCSSESELSWTVLNHQHILVFIKQRPYVVDALTLQQQWIYSQLAQSDLPLASRPLLVPVNYSLSLSAHCKIEVLKKALEQLGINAEFSATGGSMLIRSVPVQVPHLDIHAFLNHLVDSPVLQAEQLLLLLSKSQLLNLNYLSADERKVLNQVLLDLLPETESHQGLLVALTPEHCRMLLHV